MDTREIVQKILTIESILKSRKKYDNLARYNTGKVKHEKQMEFHRCKKRNRWVFGGNRCGKTECGAVETVWLARGIHPYKTNKDNVFGWVVSVSYEVQRDVAQSKILHYLRPEWIEEIVMVKGSKDSPKSGIIDTIIVRNVFGGISKIGFKSADQGREKFQGTSLDFVWFDEEPPKDIYEECRMRLLDKKGEMFGTMTPLSGHTWVYDEIFLNVYENPEVWYTQMEWMDNPFLDKEEIEIMSKSMSEEALDSRRYGRFSGKGGLVYPEFEENIHVIDPFDIPFDWQDIVSIDPGLKNPLSAHFYCTDFDGNIYVVAEHYEREKDIDYHAEKIKEIADRLNWHHSSNGEIEALIDSAAGQKTLASTKSVAELFHERGIVVNCHVNKDMFSGINTVKAKFSQRPPCIFIFRTCPEMIREIKGYTWGNNDLPVKKEDHSMDELRYYIMYKNGQLSGTKKKEETLMEINLRKLMREARKKGAK